MTGKLITDLKLTQCKFPITPHSATSHRFCAETVEYVGCPYCPKHAALCFDRRPDERKRADAQRAALGKALLARSQTLKAPKF